MESIGRIGLKIPETRNLPHQRPVLRSLLRLFSEGDDMVQKDDEKNSKNTQVAEDVKELPELLS